MAKRDVLIRGGMVVDGSGAPARRADVSISGGRIDEIGEIDGDAEQVIDATGLVVAPGFIDVHTHYDAQVFWDGAVSPSSSHGVTTIFGGNCGFSIAPLSAEAGEYLLRMLARVEGIPLETLRAGVPWDWTSFGDYLSRHEGRVAINVGFMVGHSALRRVVMGERAVGNEASEEELAAMEELLGRSLAEGGMGFSTTTSNSHNDGDGRPVPSRAASRKELLALASVLRDHPGTSLEFSQGVEPFEGERKQIMTDLSLAANRTLNWNAFVVSEKNREFVQGQLAASDYAREHGARVVGLTIPESEVLRVNFHSGFVLDMLPGWDELFQIPVEERKKLLADPDFRKKIHDSAAVGIRGVMSTLNDWERMFICETFAPENEGFAGRTCGDVAAELGKTAFDTMLDISVADGLLTSFQPVIEGMGKGSAADWAERGKTWTDDRVVIGGSDAGAHLDMIDTFSIPTRFLANGVRTHKAIGLEGAIRLLTDVPARLYGVKERGRLTPGWHADIVIFDPDTVDSGPIYTRNDLPGGANRLYADPIGMKHVFVNGVEIVRDGKDTSRRPGTVLRSGRDTYSVELATA